MSNPSKDLFIQKSPIARQQWLLLSDYLSDVTFKVGKSGQIMRAHKLVITMASEVFYAQFNGGFAESSPENRNKPVVITDIEPATFKEVLRYIYCEQANVTADNVMDIYYASQKYMLTGLNEVCELFLKTTVNEDNILKVFNGNRQHKFAEVDQLCLKIIQDNPIKCLESQDFLKLSRSALEIIASIRTMNCHREYLCSAIQKWRKANGLEVQIKPKLEALKCHKVFFYNTFQYKKDVSTDLVIFVQRKLYLYGIGVFVGRKLNSSNTVDNVLITVTVNPDITASKTVTLSKDCFIEEVMFQKVTVTGTCQIKVTVTPKPGTEFFCLNGCEVVDELGAVNLTVTNQHWYNNNCVAYLLYNIDE